tara:strand:+ start:833 stop:979 length:147 start_codon:yes stop_codon:yes gene_type:complete
MGTECEREGRLGVHNLHVVQDNRLQVALLLGLAVERRELLLPGRALNG